MKIAIPSDNKIDLALHFGRTKGFLIYEVDNSKIISKEYIDNNFTGHSQGLHHDEHSGHHHSHGNILDALKDCKVIIAHGMGRRLLDDFERAKKEVFVTSADSADAAVKLYLEGNLKHNPNQTCRHD